MIYAEIKNVKGIVVDESGESLIGATVKEKGTAKNIIRLRTGFADILFQRMKVIRAGRKKIGSNKPAVYLCIPIAIKYKYIKKASSGIKTKFLFLLL